MLGLDQDGVDTGSHSHRQLIWQQIPEELYNAIKTLQPKLTRHTKAPPIRKAINRQPHSCLIEQLGELVVRCHITDVQPISRRVIAEKQPS